MTRPIVTGPGIGHRCVALAMRAGLLLAPAVAPFAIFVAIAW